MADNVFQRHTFESLIDEGVLEIGDGYRAKNEELGGSGPMFLRAGHVTDTHIDFEGVERFHSELAEKVKPKMARVGDTIVTTKGNSTGRTSFVTEHMPPFVYSPHLSYWRTRDPKRLANGFLRYWSCSSEFTTQLAGMKASTDMAPYLSLTDQRRLKITLPPLTEQQAIACILGALDDKIELNRRCNRTLEAMAKAIFQSWFVDFDPVRAKAEGRKPARLSKELAALFPKEFEESKLGDIPKGWEITSLADEITASKGLSYKGDHLAEPGEGLPMHNLNSVYEGGGYKHEGLKWYIGEFRPAHLLTPGDVIVTNTEQGFDYLLIGYSAIVPKRYGDEGLFSHHIYRIRAKATSYLPTWFTYLLLRTPVFHELVAGHSNGTTVNMLPLDGLQKPRFVRPPEPLVQRFGKLFVPIQEQLEAIYDENITLAALRDALLPKLVTGDLRVPDAERIVGRAI